MMEPTKVDLRARKTEAGWVAASDRFWLATVKLPKPHPLFRVVLGNIAPWEKGAAPPDNPLRRTR